MSVKFKPTQIAMPLSANYGRWYGKAVTLNNVTTKELADEIAHSTTAAYFGALSCMLGMSTVYCYIVTLLHVTLRSFHNARMPNSLLIWHDAGPSVVLGSELSRGGTRELLEVARKERLVGEIHGDGY